MRKDSWTDAEEQHVINNHETMTDKEMAKGLPGRTCGAIGARRVKLGLVKYRKSYTPKHKIREVAPPDRSKTQFAHNREPWEGWACKEGKTLT